MRACIGRFNRLAENEGIRPESAAVTRQESVDGGFVVRLTSTGSWQLVAAQESQLLYLRRDGKPER